MKVWKLSMGKKEIDDTTFSKLINDNIVLVHPDIGSKGQSTITQGENYVNSKKGAIFD